MTLGGVFGDPFGGADEDLLAPESQVPAAVFRYADQGFGKDLACVSDIGFGLVTGNRVIAEALARRLQTPKGSLFYDLDYGTDLRELMLSRISEQSLFAWKARVEQECLKDDRVQGARADLTFDSEKLTVEIEVDTGEGPFTFTMTATEAAQYFALELPFDLPGR